MLRQDTLTQSLEIRRGYRSVEDDFDVLRVLLERDFSWCGILAEPTRRRHNDLTKNRTYAIDTRCVWTETGTQVAFLKSFDFSQHTFEVITCEHNFGSQRSRIQSLLRDSGYLHVFEDFSKFDVWYIRCRS